MRLLKKCADFVLVVARYREPNRALTQQLINQPLSLPVHI